MSKKLVLIDFEESIVFNGKLKGLIDILGRSFSVIKISRNQIDSFFYDSNSEYIFFIDPRQKLSSGFFNKINLDKFSVLISCNHFMVTDSSTKFFIKNNYQKLIFHIENVASLSSIKYFFEIPEIDSIKFLLVPPVLDTTDSVNNLQNVLLTRKINNNIMLAGSIYIHQWYNHKYPVHWWQRKYNVNDYFPFRKFLYDYSIKHKVFNNYSRVVYRNDSFFWFLNKLSTIIKYDFWTRHKVKYYNLNLYDGYNNSSFFWGVYDVFGVLPQICFQAMKTGCIIIGTNSITFKSLGFIDGLNYISLGSDFSVDNIQKLLKKINQLDDHDIRNLSNNSLKLVEKIEFDSKSRINDFFNNSYINCNID